MGGTCVPEELLPRGKDGSPRSIVRMREGDGRLREPIVTGDWSVRQDAEGAPQVGQSSLPAWTGGDTSSCPSGPQTNGHGRGERSGPRTWATLAQPADTPLEHKPRAPHSQQLLKKKMLPFLAFLDRLEGCRDGRAAGPAGARSHDATER